MTNVRDKLECLFLASPPSLVYCLRVRPGAFSRVEHEKGSTLYGRLLAFPINIGLSLKGLLGTNTLAYYEHSKITDIKSFISLCLGLNE